MSIVGDSHDMICKCETPFAHILYCIFPEGHKDRELTVKQIIERDLQICHSGGEEEESHGIPVGGSAATAADDTGVKVEDHTEEDAEEIEKLLAAAEENYLR